MPSFYIFLSSANKGLLAVCTIAQQAWQAAPKWNALCFIQQIRKAHRQVCKKTACHLIQTGPALPPLHKSWRCQAFLGTRKSWSLACNDAAAYHALFPAHSWLLSLPSHCPAVYLPVPWKNYAVCCSCDSYFSVWKFFLSLPHLRSAKELSCSAFHCWALWEGMEKPQMGFTLGGVLNWKRERKRERQLEAVFCCCCFCWLVGFVLVCVSSPSMNWRISKFSPSPRFECLSALSHVSEQQRECPHLLLITQLYLGGSLYFRLSHLFAETVESATESSQRRSYHAF